MQGARIGLYFALAAFAYAQSPLETGKPEHRRMEARVDSFTLDLKAGEYIEVLADQTSVDVVLQLAGPDGKQIQEVNQLAIGGTELLIQIADRDGLYKLEVRPAREGSSGEYSLTLTARRPAEARDREVAEADARFRALLPTNSPDLAQQMEEIAGVFARLGVVRREARAYRAAGAVRARAYSWDEAVSDQNKALLLWREVRDRAGESMTLIDLGAASNSTGQDEKAIDYYEQALAIQRDIGDRASQGRTLNNLGNAYSALSQYAKASSYYEQSLAIMRDLMDRNSESRILGNLGRNYMWLSQYEKALGYGQQALAAARDAKDRVSEGLALKDLGEVYEAAGQHDKAASYFEQALTIAREVRDRGFEGRSLIVLGSAHWNMGEYEKAIGYYQQALDIAREIKDRNSEGSALNNIGSTYWKLGQYEKAISSYQQSLEINREIKDRFGECYTLNNLGDTYDQLGQHDKAIGYHDQALSIAREIKAPEVEHVALDSLMQTYQALQQSRLAIFYGKQAVNVVQSTRADIGGLSEEYRRSFLETKKDTYHRLADILVSQGRLVEAQQVLNLLKEQEFIDYVRRDERVSERSGRADLTSEESEWAERYRGSSETLVTKGAQMEELRERIKKQPSLADIPDTQRQLADLERDLEAGNRAFQQFLGELKQHFASKPDVGVTAIDLRETEALKADLGDLKHGAVAIYTLVTADRYVAILVTPRVQRAYETRIKSVELNQKILAFREALEDPARDPLPMAKELCSILIPSALAEDLKQAHAETLMWSLDGPLRYVPVAALYDGKQYLIEKYRTAVFTPASNARLKEPPQTTWRGVAFGVTEAHPGFDALPAVAEELRSIIRERPGEPGVLDGRRLLDAQFTRASLDRSLALAYPVVHVASHFQFHPGDETHSFLLLGDGAELTLADLKAADTIFAGVDLLTLSACSTGLGDVKSSDGSEVEGFGVLAQRKGAKAVIASLWPVADQSTGLLMRELYRVRESNASMTKIEALRRAQLRLLSGEITSADASAARGARLSDVSAKSRDFRHPFYWAPFFLMGNWL